MEILVMLRYIKTDNSMEDFSLQDLFSSISKIKIVEDASDITINGYDPYDDVYSSYSDSQLKQLPEYLINGICSMEILKRIRQVVPEKLNPYKSAVVATYGDDTAQKYGLDDDDLNYLIDKLHHCRQLDKVIVDPKTGKMDDKTETFIHEYNLSDSDILRLIHQLKPKDFDNTTTSTTFANYHNALYVFYPKWAFTNHQGQVVEDMLIYLKLDYDVETSDGRVVALMSFHAANPDKYKKMKSDRERIKLRNKKLKRFEDK